MSSDPETMEKRRLTSLSVGNQPFEEKNIRRRIYDALNVLIALGIITKSKKMIEWRGINPGVMFDIENPAEPQATSVSFISCGLS